MKEKHKHTQHKKNKNNLRLNNNNNNVRLCDEGFKLQVSSNDKEIIGCHSSLCNEAFVSLELEDFLDYYFGTKTTNYWVILNDRIVLRLQPCSLVPRGEVVLDSNQRLSLGGIRLGDFVRFERWNNSGLSDINCSQIWVSIDWPNNFRCLYRAVRDSQIMAKVDEIIKTKFLGHVMTEGQSLLLDIRGIDGRPSSMFDMKITNIIGGKNAQGNLSRGLIEKNTIIRSFPAHIMNTETSFIKKSPRNFNLLILENELNQIGIHGLAPVLNDVFEGVFGSGSQPLPYSHQCLSLVPRNVKCVLFHGASATGKTLLARNMHEILRINTPKVINCVSPKYLFNLFSEAIRDDMINRYWRFLGGKNRKRNRLHLFIIEDIEYYYLEDKRLPGGYHPTKGMTTLSNLIDRLDNILIIGITSHYHKLRPYFLRPGRFELQIKFDLSNSSRSDLLNMLIRNYNEPNCIAEPDLDIQEIALWTYGYTAKTLHDLVRSAIYNAKERTKSTSTAKGTKVCMADFYKALINGSIKINCPPLIKGILLSGVKYLYNKCPSITLD